MYVRNDKQYLVFGWDEYYPSGGLNDVVGSFDKLEDAIRALKKDSSNYGYVYDRISGKIIQDKGN